VDEHRRYRSYPGCLLHDPPRSRSCVLDPGPLNLGPYRSNSGTTRSWRGREAGVASRHLVMARRQVQRVEFQPSEPDAVLEAMDAITRVADGWINFLPGVDADDAPPRPTGLTAVLAPRTPGALMGTWAPQSETRKGPQGATVGL